MSLSTTLKRKSEARKNQAPHIIVQALAGTGKSTTMIEGLKVLRGEEPEIEPSVQQRKIWDAMLEGSSPSTVNFTAFSNTIAKDFERRIPHDCTALTLHQMGNRVVKQHYTMQTGRDAVNKFRAQDIICEIIGTDIWTLRKNEIEFLRATDQLVGLCKCCMVWEPDMNNTDSWNKQLMEVVTHFNIPLGASKDRIFEIVPKILDRCRDVERDGCIDFNDMVWIPVINDLTVQKVDLLIWDESQDGNLVQQELARKCGERLILVGDVNQAIYGFAGADAEAMVRMEEKLSEEKRGCKILPLTETRRCGKAIVSRIQRLVPEFEACSSNVDGEVNECRFKKNHPEDYRKKVRSGDMILCRTNAPLVAECFGFLKNGQKATIQGRDIGQNLINLVNKMFKEELKGIAVRDYDNHYHKFQSVDMLDRLYRWTSFEIEKEQSKKHPSELLVSTLLDKQSCLHFFCQDNRNVDGVVNSIRDIFDDRKNVGIKLSSMHKSKGLEAKHVFVLQLKESSCPHPMAKEVWQRDQELNLLYVAESRAIESLNIVSGSIEENEKS